MQRFYEEFIESLSESVDETDIRRAMVGLLNAFQAERFAYLSNHTFGQHVPLVISNYPEQWASIYLQNSYGRIDPVIQCACNSREPFRWGRRFDISSGETEERFFEEAASFGICSGLTIPIRDRRGGCASLTLATEDKSPTLLRIADRYQLAFQLIATNFHIHVRRENSRARTIDGVQLTAREFECLQWAAKGKSAWEIGQILVITQRTAAFHLDNTRNKLGVRTRGQAIARLAASRRS